MTDLHLVVPDTVDDPGRPSGGNTYDRRVATGLPSLGWVVHEHAMPGRWPQPDEAALGTLARVVAGLPDGAPVLVDGLIASCAADVLVPEASRLRLVVLVHMPLGSPLGSPVGRAGATPEARAAGAQEYRVLSAAAAVVATSVWTRRRLLGLYALDADRVCVAEPGVDAAALAPGTPRGGELLCVAAVTPAKGHDELVAALALLADLDWRCVCAGTLDLDPAYVSDLRGQARTAGIEDRVHFVGPLGRDDLNRAYAAADLLVHASRAETYGMVVTEALAHGLPVVAMAVGGLSEALGDRPDGAVPGILVPAGATQDLAAALRLWLGDADVRQRLRALARERRAELTGWSRTAQEVSDVLERVSRP